MICGWAPGCGKVGQNTGVFLVRIHGHLKASAPTFAIPAAGFKDVQSAGRYSRQQASDSCLCIPGLRPTPAKDWLPPAFTDRPAIKVLWIRLIQRSLNGTPFGYSRRLLSYRALRPVNGNRIVSLSTPALPATVGWCVDSFPGLPARDVYCSGDRIRGDLASGSGEPRAIGLNHLHLSPHPAQAPPTPSRWLFLSQRLSRGSRRGEGIPARYPWRVHPRPGALVVNTILTTAPL